MEVPVKTHFDEPDPSLPQTNFKKLKSDLKNWKLEGEKRLLIGVGLEMATKRMPIMQEK